MDKKGSLVAIRPESIIEARFTLTARQNDILDIIFTKLENDDKTDYVIDISLYKKIYKTNTSNIYRDMEKAVESFEGKGLSLTKANSRGRIYFAWFSKINYVPSEGKIILRMDPELKLLFLDVKKRIYYNIKYTLNFKSVYSKRIYYYLKSFEDTGWRIDNLDVLRKKLQCPESYNKFSDFKRFVLNPAFNEINESSDMDFKFKEVKSGRKVTQLKFFITSKSKGINENKNVLTTNNADDINKIITLFEEKISATEARKLLSVANGSLHIIKEKYQIAKITKNITSITAWMITAIKDDYQMPQGKQQVSIFNDFEQRTYGDDLESKLLGWQKDSVEQVAATKE